MITIGTEKVNLINALRCDYLIIALSLMLVVSCSKGGYPYGQRIGDEGFVGISQPFSLEQRKFLHHAIAIWHERGIDTSHFEVVIKHDSLAYMIELVPIVCKETVDTNSEVPSDSIRAGWFITGYILVFSKSDYQLIGDFVTR